MVTSTGSALGYIIHVGEACGFGGADVRAGLEVSSWSGRSEVKLVLVKRACTLLMVAFAGAGFAQAASALDLNSFTAAPAQQQQPDWAGFYLRSNSGAGSDAIPWTTAPTNGFASSNTTPTNERFGYNFQSRNFVFGLEGSLAAANFDGRFTAPYLPAFTAGGWSPNMNWLGTVTGRFGYSFGQWLPYVKGGFACGGRRFATAGRRPTRCVLAGLAGHAAAVGPPALASNIRSRRSSRWGLNIFTPISAMVHPM